MAFYEKSAWVMATLTALAVAGYYHIVASGIEAVGPAFVPPWPALVVFIVVYVVLAIIGHIVIAAVAPSDANAPFDERDKLIAAKAGSASGKLLGTLVLGAIGLSYLQFPSTILFHVLFGALLLTTLAEYVLQIVGYRRAA